MNNDLRDALKKKVSDKIDALKGDLVAISHDIHAHPEENWVEFHAHRVLTEMVADNGVKVERSAYDVETAFSAQVGTTGPTVAVLCEYDALPGIGHACGHNIIAAAGMGAGLALAAVAEEAGGRVRLLGTPAEEGGGGKIEMARKGAFDGVDAAMMVHPSDEDNARINALAVQHVLATYVGQAAHASMAPHLGKNALDAAVLGYMNVAALRQHILPTERIHGVFLRGGDKPNIVPKETEMDWYVRSASFESLQELKKRVAACLEAGAHGTGCHCKLEWVKNPFADMKDNMPLLGAYAANSTQFGRVFSTEPTPWVAGASTDMGNVSYLVPSIHPMLAVAPKGVSLHTPEFAGHAISEAGTKAIMDGAKIMAMTAIDVWASASLRDQMRVEFGDGSVPDGVL